MQQARNIYLTGCGSAFYAALAGTYLLNEIAGVSAHAVIASEFGYLTKNLTQKDLVVAISQSGETIDLLQPLRQIQAQKIPIVALINVPGSSLYRLADYPLEIMAGPKKQ